LSGLGLMSASALAGCTQGGLFGGQQKGCWDNGNTDSPNWMVAYGTVAGAPNWYVFRYVPLAGTYTVFALKSGAAAPPDQSQTHVPYDVMSWYSQHSNGFTQATGTFTVTITASGQQKPIKVESGFISDSTSKQTLQGFKYVPLSWNEIAP
jgi:hypothetical protein